MPSANLLNTTTISYQELIGNGKSYRVPPYQRDYSWTVEQWEDLWNDIVDLDGDSDKQHYLGALVVETPNEREISIIDGQQRLATLSLLALAVIDRIQSLADSGIEQDANRERIERLRNRFIGDKDPASLNESSRLYLNKADNDFYQDYLVQLRRPLSEARLRGSHRLLWRCFKYFQGKLLSLPDDGLKVASLFSETVARQLLFILITVDDELNAYTVFETLNARGVELTTTDLIKNYLFSRVKGRADLEALQRRWRTLLETVDPARFPEFLRYHLLCEKPKIRSRQLLKLIKDSTHNRKDIFALIDALEKRAELFAALSDPEHVYWKDPGIANASKYIRELALFRTSQATPLLFAAREMFSDEDFRRTLKLVSVISFRYLVIGRRNPNELEPVYHYAAKAVLNGDDATPAAVFDRLQSIYINDEETGSSLEQFSLRARSRGKALVKYILERLEKNAGNKKFDLDTAQGTIEHILPENPEGDAWEHFSLQERDEFASRLGNLTLLESTTNRDIGNADYARKVKDYAKSDYELTKQIAKDAPDTWTLAQIKRRQKELAKKIVHLWRSDFA